MPPEGERGLRLGEGAAELVSVGELGYPGGVSQIVPDEPGLFFSGKTLVDEGFNFKLHSRAVAGVGEKDGAEMLLPIVAGLGLMHWAVVAASVGSPGAFE